MGLSGKLETMGLPEVLQWISMMRKTGTLYLRRRAVEKRIVFREGALYSSWSNHPRESLGQFLLRDRRVSEEQLFRVLLRQEQEGRLLGALLVEEGAITQEELRQALRTKAQETVYDLFLWPDGRFEFREGEFTEMLHVDLPVTEVIMEGIRRVDEWSRIRGAFPAHDASFSVQGGATSEDPAEAQALELAAAGRTLPQIALEMRRSEFDAASLLFSLHERGLLSPDRPREPRPPPADPVETIVDRLNHAGRAMRERHFQAARQAYEEVLALDRLNQTARKGLAAAEEALERERAVRTVPLDAVPVLAMTLLALTAQTLDPQEGFVLSRVNGTWDVKSILKICPLAESEALAIFARLVERGIISLQ